MTASTASHHVPTTSDAKDAVSGTGSREQAKSGYRVPATASPRPTTSRPRPGHQTRFWDENALPRPALSMKRDAGRGSSGDPELAPWIDSLKARQLTIGMAPDGPRINGRNLHLVTPTDTHQLTRHRHALQLAAAGQHPTWWTHAIGTGPTPNLADLPTIDDPDDRWGGWGFPCACCGTPADRLDEALLPWCTEHAA